ncbi:ADP-ribosylglycohydrolase family protein [Lacrimispora sp.]|uniref:ADP-ribosylglycohydrolase family protein n=1 Tax=Lacrimispora sp. TaxID=2719234 RepID=UPI002FD96FC8
MIGAIIGNIVGSRFEFNNHISKNFELFGNGAAMRDSPAGFTATTELEAEALSETVTAVIHNHDEGIKGANAVTIAIYLACRGLLRRSRRHERKTPRLFRQGALHDLC